MTEATDAQTGVPNPPDSGAPTWHLGRGRIHFHSERDNGRPFNNCLVCCGLMGQEWQGYRCPPGYDNVVRTASGVPDFKPNGDVQGTSLADVQRGLKAVFPIAGTIVHYTEAQFLGELKPLGGRGRGKSTFAISVNTKLLPPHFQQLVGQTYDGLHGWFIFAKTDEPLLSVGFCDPMGQEFPGPREDAATFEPYTYQVIAWADLKPAIFGFGDGTIDAIRFVKNAARVPAA